jgi:hypothetical protein
MSKLNLSPLELLSHLTGLGFNVSLEGDDLLIRGAEGKQIEAGLLNEIKTQKEGIMQYLRLLKNKTVMQFNPNLFENIIQHDGNVYHKLTPIEKYWVDNKIDQEYKQTRKFHGQKILNYEIMGKLNAGNLQLAIEKLVERHESLRATFHEIEGDHAMRINNHFDDVYVDYQEFSSQETDRYNTFIAFSDHEFKFGEKMFLARIAKVHGQNYILSLKFHHVISDTWSVDIVFRDLIKLYNRLDGYNALPLPPLKYQFKDYLAVSNAYRNAECEKHRNYWNTLFTKPPDELIIPEAKPIKTPMNEKICRRLSSVLSAKTVNKLNNASMQYNCSRFIILQALFKLYIFNKTKQSDIVVGTFVFGREVEDSQNQIGCFATTVLLRTVIEEVDSFKDVVKKVIRANEDMKEYKAFSLMECLQEQIGPKGSLYGTFWKINLQYIERSALANDSFINTTEIQQVLNDLSIRSLSFEIEPDHVIPIDMQLEFEITKNGINLNAEYDSSLYSEEGIKKFIAGYREFVNQEDCEIL